MISRLGCGSNLQYNCQNKENLTNGKKNEANLLTNQCVTSSQTHSKKNVSFGAGMPLVDGSIAFINWMENGGKAVEFTIIDCLSMIFPRTFQAYNRNSQELGHPNYKAGTEEAIREFLTGPSMFLIPVLFTKSMGKVFGKAAEIGFNNQNKFKDVLLNEAQSGLNKNSKSGFYKKIFGEFFTDGNKAEELAKKLIDIERKQNVIDKTKKSFRPGTRLVLFAETKMLALTELLAKTKIQPFVNMRDNYKESIKTDLKLVDNLAKKAKQIAKLTEDVAEATVEKNIVLSSVKKRIAHFISPDAVHIKQVGDSSKTFTVSAKQLVSDMVKYGEDVINKAVNAAKDGGKVDDIVNKLASQRRGGRLTTIIPAIISTATFLYCIPMLYKRNKEYPGVDGLVKKTPEQTNAQQSVKTTTQQTTTNNVQIKQPSMQEMIANPSLKPNYQQNGGAA